MHQRFLGVVGAILAGTCLAQAQAPVPTSPALPALPDFQGPSHSWAPVVSQLPGVAGTRFWSGEGNAPTPSFWVNGEFGLWSIKEGPSLSPGLAPLFAGKGLDSYAPSMRLTVGGALDPSQKIGVEGSGLFLEQHSTGTFPVLPHQWRTR